MPRHPRTDHDWRDISTEKRRVYVFISRGRKVKVYIDEPEWLAVTPRGHQIVTKDGHGHYVPNGWVHMHQIPHPGCETGDVRGTDL